MDAVWIHTWTRTEWAAQGEGRPETALLCSGTWE